MKILIDFISKSGIEIFETISVASQEILILTGLIALILYIFGYEKGKNIAFICPSIYYIIQIIANVILK